MAFFGIRWLPVHDVTTTATECNPIELWELTLRIRQDSKAALAEQYHSLEAKYTTAYNSYIQLSQSVEPSTQVVETRLTSAPFLMTTSSTPSATLAKLVTSAGKYRISNNAKYYQVVAEIKASPGSGGTVTSAAVTEALTFLEQEYVSYLQSMKNLQESENQLWASHASMGSCQQAYELFEFEAKQATKQLEEVKVKLRVSDKKDETRIAGNEQRLKEIRAKNKAKLKERRMHKKESRKKRNEKKEDGLLSNTVLQGLSPILGAGQPDGKKERSDDKALLNQLLGKVPGSTRSSASTDRTSADATKNAMMRSSRRSPKKAGGKVAHDITQAEAAQFLQKK